MQIKLNRFLWILFVFVAHQLFSQTYYDFGFQRSQSISVLDSLGINLPNPWVGGFNSVHFNSVDLDLDGKEDLVVFDVHGDKLYPFLNMGTANQTAYNYHPEYIHHFPEIKSWMQCVDYDNDGRKDLFTYVQGGMSVYRNISTSASGLYFQLVDPLLSYDNNINILTTSVDYPAIADIDFDGDLDILSFYVLGMYVVMYRNLSMETYGNADHLVFTEGDRCWGHIAESEEINSIYLDTLCNNKGSIVKAKNGPKHTGSTILPINLNGDTLMDILLGDVDFFTLNALTNGGSRLKAHIISQDTVFPSYDTTINLVSFPLASYIDIDNDNTKELLVSPFEAAYYKPEALNSVWMYENSGSNDHPVFNFQTKNFLQNQMIEVGDNATPEVVDVDGDGLMDLVVSSYGIVDSTYFDMANFILWTHKSSKMVWYKNIGTTTQPQFRYMDGDIFDLFSFELTAIKPTFGDLDNDGDKDMIIGNSDGKLWFFENIAGFGNMMTFAPPVTDYQSVDVGEFSTPELFDIDSDGLLDLVIGQKQGKLHYYRNTGSITSPTFTFVTNNMGNVNVNTFWHYWYGYSVPEVFRDDKDSLVMLVGSASGHLFYYRNIAGNETGIFSIDSNLFYTDSYDSLYSVAFFMNEGNIPEYLNVGMRSAAAVYDWDNDGRKDLMVGNFSGGLNSFKGIAPPAVGLKPNKQDALSIGVYPNPASDFVMVDFSQSIFPVLELQLIDLNGKLIHSETVAGKRFFTLSLSGVSSGLYILKVNDLEGRNYFQSKLSVISR
ncbi:MAG: T9SS type A sorting domain-containing protein [Bacteroidales bacterium]|nr:T9SS type A sorting domain-containing protein [Bacteroidales bacterium]